MSESPKTVLLVDDNEPLVRLYQNILDAEGYHARVATTRERALEILGELHDDEAPDLILLDCSMPGMSLRTFLDRMHAIGPPPRARILGFSSYSRQSPHAEHLNGVLHDFVEKPDDIDRFLDIIRQYLN